MKSLFTLPKPKAVEFIVSPAPPQEIAFTWWAEYRVTRGYQVFVGQITQAETRPGSLWWGPFHCRGCADICANYGKTQSQAFDFNHGTDDEKFGVFLGDG
jgi:hypothetical protein